MSRNQSTPLNQLPNPMDTKINDNDQDQDIVNEILNEIDNQTIMDNHTIMDNQTMNDNNEKIHLQQEEQIQMPILQENKEPLKKNLLLYFKNTLIVIFLVFMMSLPFLDSLLVKIPKAILNGNITLIGKLIKSLFAGLIFFILEKFI